MQGREILRAIIEERLRELDGAPHDFRVRAGDTVYAFCLGAARALVEAGMLSLQDQSAILDDLGSALEDRGLVTRVTETLERRLNAGGFERSGDE